MARAEFRGGLARFREGQREKSRQNGAVQAL